MEHFFWSILLSLLSLTCGWLGARFKQNKEEEAALKDGVCALLKYEIVKIYIRSELHEMISYSDSEALMALYNALKVLNDKDGSALEMVNKAKKYRLVTSLHINKMEEADDE